ncbi:hypothetical protein ES703_81168 [subsurface metagenome]
MEIPQGGLTKFLFVLYSKELGNQQSNTGKVFMYNDDKKFRVIGQRIKRLREERGLIQKVLASRLGIGRSHLANLERGHEKPGRAMVWSLSRLFDVSMMDIIDKEIAFYNSKEREFFKE